MSASPGPVAAVIQARMTSTRLPGKVLKPLAGEPLVRRVIERVHRIEGVDRIVVALAEGAENDALLPALEGCSASVVRGPVEDVLARTANAARSVGAGTVMRITSDCPLIDPHVSASVLSAYRSAYPAGTVYARTSATVGYPHGFDTEVICADALYAAEAEAVKPADREHVTPFIRERGDRFPGIEIVASPDRRHWRLTVDTEDDYRLAGIVYDALYPRRSDFGYADLVEFFSGRPELLEINANHEPPAYNGPR